MNVVLGLILRSIEGCCVVVCGIVVCGGRLVFS